MTAPATAPAGTAQIADISAQEILDSCGRPTLQVRVTLDSGATGRAGVPSGASTGSREAVERRDGDQQRYHGLGVLGVVGAVNREIARRLTGRLWHGLAEVDAALIDLDGTPGKERLGADAAVGVSMAARGRWPLPPAGSSGTG